jgi:hypothetical protein
MLCRIEGVVAQPHHEVTSVRLLAPGAQPAAEAPAALVELADWWERKAAAGLPDRCALDPVEFGRHLPFVALLDVEPDDFRFRLAGEEVRSRYGPLRGHSLGELLSGEARAQTLAEHRQCVEARRPVLTRHAEPTSDGTDRRRYWRLLLPFGRDGRATAILAAMQFDAWRPDGVSAFLGTP